MLDGAASIFCNHSPNPSWHILRHATPRRSDLRARLLKTDVAQVSRTPDLIIEILSPSTRRRDEGVKLKLYERFDVLEYWIVDPRAESVRVYRRQALRLERVVEVTRDEAARVTTPLLPGLSVPLAKLFA